jgi:hypothetical protein
MITPNRVGVLGLFLLVLGVALLLYPTWHTGVTDNGSMAEFLAYCAFIYAGLWGPRKWLFLLLLSPASAFLCLVAQGH